MVTFGQKKETRTVSGFTGIDASGAFDITVVKGSTEALTIETNDAVMPQVRSEVRNGVLYLYLDGVKKVKNVKTLKATVVMKNLDRVTLSGACSLTSNDLFTPDSFNADCSGASDMKINLHTGQLSIKASGASDISIKANVTGDAGVAISSASDFRGELNAKNVIINASSASDVDISGSATDFKLEVSGASDVKAQNFIVKTATVVSSGSSDITVNVSDTLKVNVSGTSTVKYKGSPTVEMNRSGASTIKKI